MLHILANYHLHCVFGVAESLAHWWYEAKIHTHAHTQIHSRKIIISHTTRNIVLWPNHTQIYMFLKIYDIIIVIKKYKNKYKTNYHMIGFYKVSRLKTHKNSLAFGIWRVVFAVLFAVDQSFEAPICWSIFWQSYSKWDVLKVWYYEESLRTSLLHMLAVFIDTYTTIILLFVLFHMHLSNII